MENAVGRAIDALGGLTQATIKTGIASSTWVRWRQKGYIDDAKIVLDVSEQTGIDARELVKT